MMKKLIAPSMMCADFEHLKAQVNALDAAGIDVFHMDVMDGHYVPNVALGVEDFKAIRKLTKTPMDIHLMVDNPDDFIAIFAPMKPQIIYVHPDTVPMVTRTLANLKDLGIHPGIAINPGISFEQVQELLPLVDYVLVMTVNPGFAGQPFLDYTLPKIKRFVAVQDEYPFTLFVDGAISPERVKMLSNLGVNGFVVGTSALFGKEQSYATIVSQLKEQ
ncbi:ribulose-phosphate 3-epimerase [Lactiplantibacillus plantarum]|uniref:ribulose-phosphate 3-epimerase n=2 Tax=Lactiplantibacillus plantarum TaxID=1590 RepID=UPI001F3FFF80|nr:ribulose-phosphate 3-epimerase [Lactiplantibacillus plantarum]UJS15834.1 ribulose-phosphate 3-epimerase [Lactiplantibacillus plantarum subsp. plantarum]WJM33377.1 ribulose-phosphate 3-epimerase [Lactiplantibacillus plantarum]WRM32845.1 ribulose-phosphate 3-epimerase [Lactiplantibacillus plantarum]